jgi:COP9 signalosome complex subunit 3
VRLACNAVSVANSGRLLFRTPVPGALRDPRQPLYSSALSKLFDFAHKPLPSFKKPPGLSNFGILRPLSGELTPQDNAYLKYWRSFTTTISSSSQTLCSTSHETINMDDVLPKLLTFPPHPPPQPPLSDSSYDEGIKAQISAVRKIAEKSFLQQTSGGEGPLDVCLISILQQSAHADGARSSIPP